MKLNVSPIADAISKAFSRITIGKIKFGEQKQKEKTRKARVSGDSSLKYVLPAVGFFTVFGAAIYGGYMASKIDSFNREFDTQLEQLSRTGEQLLIETKEVSSGRYVEDLMEGAAAEKIFEHLQYLYTFAQNPIPESAAKVIDFSQAAPRDEFLHRGVADTSQVIRAAWNSIEESSIITAHSLLAKWYRRSSEDLLRFVTATGGQINNSITDPKLLAQARMALNVVSTTLIYSIDISRLTPGSQQKINESVNFLRDISEPGTPFRGSVEDLNNAATRLTRAADVMLNSEFAISRFGEQIAAQNDLIKALRTTNGNPNYNLVWQISIGLLIFSFIFPGIAILMNARKSRLDEIKARQERDDTDKAIIALMEELVPISDGDLTARATVTEHVTGAIADRINMMAESLQNAIRHVGSATADSNKSMTDVLELIRQSAKSAEDATFGAQDAKAVAEEGASIVSSAADKMGEARERMQEASKRVKHLGEMAQSVSSVVDVIEEVAQKTSILALNTSLKAAEAGEEGQSFRIIAEEIRTLSNSTRRSLTEIRSNIRAIQSGTQAVISTMEQTTSNVVEGSNLLEDSRTALSNIQSTSVKIEQMINRLTTVTESQVGHAEQVSGSMTRLSQTTGKFVVDKLNPAPV